MIAENPHTPDRPIGAALGRDISRGELVEHELDNFIAKRHNQRVASEGERDEESAWVESERRHTAARRAANRSEWHLYHLAAADRLRATLGSLVAHHEEQAERYLPKGAA